MKRRKLRPLTYEDLMGGYGQSRHHRSPVVVKQTPGFVSKSFDTGEVLVQRSEKPDFIEYVVQSSVTDVEFEEYTVTNTQSLEEPMSFTEVFSEESFTPQVEYGAAPAYDIVQEFQVNVLDPLNSETPELSLPVERKEEFPSILKESKHSEASEISRPQATEDDFTADMEAIFKGEKIYDPIAKKTIDKSQNGKPPALPSNGNTETMFDPKKSEHAIFDKIAQSMQYANAYDLGSVDLDKRFSDFDTINDLEKRSSAPVVSSPSSKSIMQTKGISNTEFIEDLDAIRKASLPKQGDTASSDAITDVKAEEEMEKII